MSRTAEVRRAKSRAILLPLGITVPGHLPELDEGAIRKLGEVADRLLCLNACVAAASGFPRERSLAWLDQEKLAAALEPVEAEFLQSGVGAPAMFQWQAEGMYALAGAVSMYEQIDVLGRCPDDLVHRFPNLKVAESAGKLLRTLALRSEEEIAESADLAYCAHWALREADLKGASIPTIAHSRYSIGERRRALEWLMSDEGWYEVCLDT